MSFKRKFLPGPAGLLTQSEEPSRDAKQSCLNIRKKTYTFPDDIDERQSFLNNKQHLENALWFRIRDSCGSEGRSLLDKYNIATIHQLAQGNHFTRDKIPLMCAVIDKIDALLPDAKAVLADQTGFVRCTIDRSVVQMYRKALLPGAIFLLKQVSILKLHHYKLYLNITTSNIVKIFISDVSSLSSSRSPLPPNVLQANSRTNSWYSPILSNEQLYQLIDECLEPSSVSKNDVSSKRCSEEMTNNALDTQYRESGRLLSAPKSASAISKQTASTSTSVCNIRLPKIQSETVGQTGENCWRLRNAASKASCEISIEELKPSKTSGLRALLRDSSTLLADETSHHVVQHEHPTSLSIDEFAPSPNASQSFSYSVMELLEEDMDVLLASVVE